MTETVEALRLVRTVRADRQTVWNAWTRPEEMRIWACPAPGGLKEATADLRVGGHFTMRMEVEGVEHNAFGTYREVDEPNRLVYTWDWREEDQQMGETVVTVDFREVDGGTEIVLVHEGFPVDEAKAGHAEGWELCLSHLAGHVDA